MSVRFPTRLIAPRPVRRRRMAWATSLIMAAGLLQATPLPVNAAPRDNEPAVQNVDSPAPARPAPPVRARKPDNVSKLAAKVPTVTWPAAGSAELALNGRTPAKASIGGLAVTVTPDAPPAAKAAGRAAAPSPTPATVRVETLDRAASDRAGVAGPVLKVVRADGAAGTAKPVTLSVDYRGFAGAYGGDFGARLGLLRLPDCALSTPEAPACAPQRVSAINNTETGTLSAKVSAGSTQTLYALAAAESSTQGNYGATPLAPSAKWSVSPASGAYNWNYPITVPPVPGGQIPSISLGYNSQTVDGRTTTTNNQGSWVGEGFGYDPGYVERQYKACSDDGHATSADLCWAYDNATIMLNGKSNTLVRHGNGWRFSSDDGSKIERFAGAPTRDADDDNDNEYWKVTTTDGTQYHFGLNRLPGWAAGKDQTESVWTVPVYGDDQTNAEDDKQEPCYNATFANAFCQQAWRWNLDYVKDVHGNVTSYFYGKEVNHYARGGKLAVNGVPYTPGGFLRRIDYGQRAGAVYTSNAPARVVFDTRERCLPTATMACRPQDLKPATAASWQDTPVDRICAAATKCTSSQLSPSFFTRNRLTGITTQIRSGAAWVPVDGWALGHTFTNNGDGSRSLWLQSITHSGYGGIAAAPIVLPSVTLQPLQLPNRIDIPNDNVAPLVRPRLSTVYTESGAQIDVNYAPADCSAGALPAPGKSTKRCYPVRWSPGGQKEPITDWFHKYVVEQVIETDRTGGAPDQVTRYGYVGDAAWRYADASGLSKDEAKYLTWNQWRGYQKVNVVEGDGQTMTTRSEHTFLRGMDGNKDPDGGTTPVTREDSVGATYRDADELAAFEIEVAVYDGAKVLSKTTTKPLLRETASVTHPWGTDKAHFVLPAESRGFTRLADGDWRQTKSVTSYHPTLGRTTQVENFGDISTAADDQCARTEYADNAALGIFNLISRKETVAVHCDATPDRSTQVLVDELTYYDGKALGEAPVVGNATLSMGLAEHDGKEARYVKASESVYDQYGRPTLVKDGAGTATAIAYTQVDGLTTKKVETGPLGNVTTEYDPLWAHPVAQTDMNDKRTALSYDKLGRLTAVFTPTFAKGTPSVKYTYSLVKDKPVYVKTEKFAKGGRYRAEYQIYDGFLRPRQVQAEGVDGGRLVADTFYTSTGKVAKVNDTYYAKGAPSGDILPSRNGDVDGQTAYIYDGADRVTNTILLRAGDEKWRTTTTYHGGDRVSVQPPKGGTATTTISNAQGQTVQLLQHKGAKPSGDADTTKYTYTAAGKLSTVTDPAGNVWQHHYDQRGREIKTKDPDAGTTTSTYDELDRLESTKDARGVTLTHTYDSIGRKTATHQGDAKTGVLLSSWEYDTVYKGQLYSSIRYVNGHKYEVRRAALDSLYRTRETQYVIPKEDAGEQLGGLYRFFTNYNLDGTVQSTGFPAAGGLPVEGIAYLYDDLQRVTRIEGKNTYATSFSYAQTGELLKVELNTGGRKAWATAEYEQATKRLKRAGVTRQMIITPGGPPDPTPVNDVDQKYTYDEVGNVLSVEDTPASGARDIQCFSYDNLRRMSEAWTSASQAEQPCAGGAEATGVGGVAPYHDSYTFDTVGNRDSKTSHAIGATPKSTQEYAYPDPDPKAVRPHAVTSMTEKTAAGDRLHTYEYDDAGNTIKRSEAGEDQDLTWDAEGNLASVTKAGKTTSFVYSADGARLVRKEPGTTTVYLAGLELRLNTETTAVAGTRFYPVSGQATVVRTVAGLQFQFNDRHGTGQAAVDADSGAITHRRTDPFGNARGKQPDPGTWMGEKGFVGGNQDTTTGLTHLGARLYDPKTARFMSVDPIIDVKDPQQMNAYSYANNSPVTYTDPAGTRPLATGGGAEETRYWAERPDQELKINSNGKWSVVKTGRQPRDNGPSTKSREVLAAEARAEKAKQVLIAAGKALGQIAMEELGIKDALDCLTTGDLGSCAETVLNVASVFVGGLVTKLARKYGAPWKWDKAAALGRQLWDLGAKIVDGIKTWMKETKLAKALARCENSFRAGTWVLLANGSLKRIEKMTVRDKVLATDPVKKLTRAKRVVATHINLDTKLTDLRVIDAAGRRSVVHTTQEHPFWNATTKSWAHASTLSPGDALQTPRGSKVRVTAVKNFVDRETMYNLTIRDIHTYYVLAGNTPVLVHNCREVSKYEDITRPGARMPNRLTDVGPREFGETLESNGWNRVDRDWGTVYEKKGARYQLRDHAKTHDGWTAEFFKPGSKKADLKIRLGED